jgi:hypothetical protein
MIPPKVLPIPQVPASAIAASMEFLSPEKLGLNRPAEKMPSSLVYSADCIRLNPEAATLIRRKNGSDKQSHFSYSYEMNVFDGLGQFRRRS